MSLADLLRALGVRELARRLGIKPATVERWIRAGKPSTRGQARLEEVAERRRRSLQGVETSKKRAAFRERLAMPSHPVASSSVAPFATGYLTPDQVLPRKPPVETAEQLERIRKRAGHDAEGYVDTDLYTGESVWLPIGQPLAEVDLDEVADDVIRIWQDSGRDWAHVMCMLFRYIPFNPFYTGKMIAKQGRWFDFWVQTKLLSPMKSAMNYIAIAIKTMLIEPMRSADTRVIWFEAAKVRTFDNKKDPNYARALRRQLRAT